MQYSVQAARFATKFDDENEQQQTFERQNRRQKSREKKWDRKNKEKFEDFLHEETTKSHKYNRV
jgi:hypothetical protein